MESSYMSPTTFVPAASHIPENGPSNTNIYPMQYPLDASSQPPKIPTVLPKLLSLPYFYFYVFTPLSLPYHSLFTPFSLPSHSPFKLRILLPNSYVPESFLRLFLFIPCIVVLILRLYIECIFFIPYLASCFWGSYNADGIIAYLQMLQMEIRDVCPCCPDGIVLLL